MTTLTWMIAAIRRAQKLGTILQDHRDLDAEVLDQMVAQLNRDLRVALAAVMPRDKEDDAA